MTTPSITTGGPSLDFAPWPYYDEDDIAAVQDVLRSGKVSYWTGEQCLDFEREYAAYLGVRHAIALANGSVSLELALYALNIGAGDEVIVTPRTFIASGSAIVLRGATPIFCDVDRDSGNISALTIAPVISPRTKAIITVHLAGWPCEMDAIMDLAREHHLAVVEDCAQSHGAMLHGQHVGAFGDVAAWSFCQDKVISTGGEGGMVTTNNESLWHTMWSYKDHGKSWDAVYHRDDGPGFNWLHESFGTNFRMTEMQAAIGRRQLCKLERWVESRNHHAQIYCQLLGALSALRIAIPAPHIRHAYYKFYAYVRPETLKSDWNRDRILDELTALGIPCGSGSCSEIYLEKAFTRSQLSLPQRLPVAKELGETSMMFLVHPTLSDTMVADMAQTVADVVQDATR